jgi:hypothetical protein
MYQKRHHEDLRGYFLRDVSRMNQETATSLYQKLKEFLRTQAEDQPSIRYLKWLSPDKKINWREPTFQEFLNYYNIIIIKGHSAGKEK